MAGLFLQKSFISAFQQTLCQNKRTESFDIHENGSGENLLCPLFYFTFYSCVIWKVSPQ